MTDENMYKAAKALLNKAKETPWTDDLHAMPKQEAEIVEKGTNPIREWTEILVYQFENGDEGPIMKKLLKNRLSGRLAAEVESLQTMVLFLR